MKRLVVVQPYIPRYRTAFYAQAGEALANKDIELEVVVGRTDSSRADGDADFPAILSRDLLESTSRGRLRYRPLRAVGATTADLLVLEQAIKNLDGYLPLLRRRLGSPAVALWGHGRSYSSTQSSTAARLKQWMTRRSDWFFAYTPSGAQDVMRHGFPPDRVTILYNTIDAESLARDLKATTGSEVARFQAEHDVDPRYCALFLGGVDSLKAVDFLVESVRAAHRLEPRFRLLIAGSGADASKVAALQRAGLPVRVLGRVDGRAKALALKSAQVLPIPSQLGLVVVDSLASGVPIVTREASLHGPEAEYLTPGTDSVWLSRRATPGEYAAAVIALLKDQPRHAAMAQACLDRAHDYPLSRMVTSFVEGVDQWTRAPRRRAQGTRACV
ncbi:MAG: glycosyltransferase family 4 protein [Candidatus Nanopelagicales bacterium]